MDSAPTVSGPIYVVMIHGVNNHENIVNVVAETEKQISCERAVVCLPRRHSYYTWLMFKTLMTTSTLLSFLFIYFSLVSYFRTEAGKGGRMVGWLCIFICVRVEVYYGST
jgi:hypothetical protein